MAKQNEGWMTPVPRQSLSKMVVEKIKEGLISGEIVPGEYLPSENELTERLGVGKSSIREAIKMLEAMGVVEICNASEEDIQRLKEVHEKTKRDFKKGKVSVSNDMEFHNTIYECTHNPFVVCIGKSVLELCLPSLYTANRDYSSLVTKDHDSILDAIEKRDKIAFEKAIEKSLSTWKELALGEE